MSNFVVGQEFASNSYPINRDSLKLYADASGDQNPIHQDEEFAKSVGLPDVIAHGMLTMGLAANYLNQNFGAENIQGFSVRFVKPVVVPENQTVELKISAKVTDVNDTQAKIELICQVQDIKVLGRAIAFIKI
jgi:acyl dehydratase